jgi:hypothetical protein
VRAPLAAIALLLLSSAAALADDAPSTPTPPARVHVGAFLNDIQSIDLKLHSYAADVYIWFRWSDPEIDPAATLEFANPSELWGHVKTQDWEKPQELPSGELYQVVRVQGRFSKKLPLYSYPFDRQTLLVAFEDAVHDETRLVYVPDASDITINPELVIPGFTLGEPRIALESFAYPTHFGDARRKGTTAFSRVRIEVPISRPVLASALKFLLPIGCVVLCAALMFLFRASYVDSRVGIGITALLTIVALQITLNEDLPDVDYLVLMDKVYIGAYLYVIAGLAIVVETTRLVDAADPASVARAERLSRRSLIWLSAVLLAAVAALVAYAIRTG